MKVSIYRLSDWIIYAIVIAVSVGQIEQWAGLFNVNVWLFFYLFTTIVLSMFVIAAEKQYLQLSSSERRSIFYLLVVMAIWYAQKVYSLSHVTSSFEVTCRRDLLLVTTITSTVALTMSTISVFTALIFLV